MLVLGIDPGLVSTGFAIIKQHIDGNIYSVGTSTVTTCSSESLPKRLLKITCYLERILKDYNVSQIGIEEIFVNKKNPLSSIKLCHARGAILSSCAKSGIPIYEFSARYIKQNIVGTGNATKDQVRYMSKVLIKDSYGSNEHEFDAYATAYVCLTSNR